MTDNRATLLRDVLRDWDAGELALGEIPGLLIDVALSGDLEAQLEEVEPGVADWCMWLLRDHFAPIIGHAPQDYGIIEGVTVRPGGEEAYREDLARREDHMRKVRIPAIQAWLARRPLPLREPFPVAAVRRIAERVKCRKAELLQSRPAGLDLKQARAWIKAAQIDVYANFEAELESALRRGADGPAGSQEQAVAWDGLERLAAELALHPELTDADISVVAAARDQRAERLSGIRAGTVNPSHRATSGAAAHAPLTPRLAGSGWSW